ncbi:transposase family protein [Zavarzinella formosa]|uniref:transposase family protein n=1 Tax=Zavarzinella formosa TaxID=360055 RepID=UPI000312E1C3|nr:transposase family protein [Zavarzinella formosa]
MADVRIGLEEIARHFADLEDPRSSINQLHPFVSVVVITMMGVLAGAGGPASIARRARFKKPFLERVLDLPHGVPGKDVFRRALSLLQRTAFQACFASWLNTPRQRKRRFNSRSSPWTAGRPAAATTARTAQRPGVL